MKTALALLALAAGSPPQEGWDTLPVPGTWERGDGFAWTRCYVKVPDRWAVLGGRTLWVESLTFTIGEIADAYEVYLNGRKICGSGSFPPRYASGFGAPERVKVPVGILKKGVWNVIAVRIYTAKGKGGFKGPAPVFAGYHNEIVLKGDWEFRRGDDPSFAGKPVAKKPARATFDRAVEATTVLKATKLSGGPRLDPAVSLKKMKVAEDLALDQLLTEPLVGQPLYLHFDERGRLWVVQYRQYPYPAGLKMISRDKYYRSVFDKVPPPPPHHDRGRDRISIHEDTDGDGLYDRHKIFLDGMNIMTAVERGRGGVWVLHPPYLLFYPDRDRDDVPDSDPIVCLQGFGLEDTHSVANSLRWGPDGWLYGAHGSTVSSRVKRPGSPEEPVYIEGPGMWRYHPEMQRFEIVTWGGGNSFSLEVDAKGRFYTGNNGGRTRGFHYLQGAYYQKGSDVKYGPPRNPYAFGYLPFMKHAPVPRFTHTMLIYEGGALPTAYRGKLFCADPLHRNIVIAAPEPDGSSFKTEDVGTPLESEDPGFRPVEIKVGPDGGVYIADFHEFYIAHGQHYQGQIDPDSGRIYRLRAKDAEPLKAFDLGGKTSEELIEVLGHPNRWFRQTALRILGDRKDRSVLERVSKLCRESNGQIALEALWAVYQCGGFDASFALRALKHSDPQVRMWTVRLVGDAPRLSRSMLEALVKLSGSEPNAEVRSQLACTAKRHPGPGLRIVRALLKHDGDVGDPFIPLLLWWAVEAHCADHRDAVLRLFEERSLWDRPLVSKGLLGFLMRRFAAAGTRRDLAACARLLNAAPERRHRDALMKGFEQAFKGRSLSGLPEELMEAIARAGGGSLLLRVRRGEGEAVRTALETIANPKADARRRVELASIFGEVRRTESVKVLLGAVAADGNAELRRAALTSLLLYDDPAVGSAVIRLYPSLPAEVREAAQTLLSARPGWSLDFLRAVEQGRVEKKLVPREMISKMKLHGKEKIEALLKKHFAAGGAPTTEAMRREIGRLAGVLRGGDGSPYAGKKLFEATCVKCHTLFSRGGKIGPDLTAYKRDDIDTMLLNIVNPSAEIREGFETYLIATTDGRIMDGFLVDQDRQIVVLRGTDGQNITLPRDQIRAMKATGRSLMPERLLGAMSDRQVRDLFAYLRQGQPIGR